MRWRAFFNRFEVTLAYRARMNKRWGDVMFSANNNIVVIKRASYFPIHKLCVGEKPYVRMYPAVSHVTCSNSEEIISNLFKTASFNLSFRQRKMRTLAMLLDVKCTFLCSMAFNSLIFTWPQMQCEFEICDYLRRRQILWAWTKVFSIGSAMKSTKNIWSLTICNVINEIWRFQFSLYRFRK